MTAIDNAGDVATDADDAGKHARIWCPEAPSTTPGSHSLRHRHTPAGPNTDATSGVEDSVNRVDKHDRPKQSIAARLRRLGATVHAAPAASSYDMLVDGETRVTLRVAYPGLRRHRVTVGGRSYRYRYRSWHFNFHHHGRFAERYTDVFICIAVNPEGRNETFVIPWEQVSGKTFSLHGGRGRYNGRYAEFRDGWERVRARGGAARSLRRVA